MDYDKLVATWSAILGQNFLTPVAKVDQIQKSPSYKSGSMYTNWKSHVEDSSDLCMQRYTRSGRWWPVSSSGAKCQTC